MGPGRRTHARRGVSAVRRILACCRHWPLGHCSLPGVCHRSIMAPTERRRGASRGRRTAMTETRLITPEEIRQQVEGRVVHLAERPIPFATFLELSTDREVELVGGVMVEKMAAQLEHEKLFTWLDRVVGTYVSHRRLGILLGSRTAVEISAYGGPLPDLLFVRSHRLEIVPERAASDAPDLGVEIVAPND